MLLTIKSWFFICIAATILNFLTQKDRSQYFYGFTYGLLFLLPVQLWAIILYLVLLPFAEDVYRLKGEGFILLGLAIISLNMLLVFTALYIIFAAFNFIINKAYKTEIKNNSIAALFALIVVYGTIN